mmetsp:Transcript_18471/g.31612  ORF Transcript_18471/g.31612 Transcript_18471/m.31612 type:complete len:83 (-) Transcript_18471:463-711(-)
MRILLIAILLVWVLPDFLEVLSLTWNMTQSNWWRSSEEPFWGNCSAFNALVAWSIWLLYITIEYLIIIFFIILIIFGVSTLS